MLKAIIIDDEPDCVKLLALQLKMYCPQVEVVAECTESAEGLTKITALLPDIVFLDIKMPGRTGFEILDDLRKIRSVNPYLVFTTAYDEYAIKAFEYAAFDYLLKPIDLHR